MRTAAARVLMAMVPFAALLVPIAASAQTTVDPTSVEFEPSTDHSRTAADGTPLVTSYVLEILPSGSTIAAFSIDLGKPTPGADGVIRMPLEPLLPTPLVGGTVYQGRVLAVGPGGTAASQPSNTFASSAPCAPLLSATSASLPSTASTGSVTVSVGTTCVWTAAANPNPGWLRITSAASVTGAGTASFAVDANPATTVRTGSLSIAGQTVNITQAGASSPPCTYGIDSTSRTVAAVGEAFNVTVTTSSGCAWTATSGAAWITVPNGTNRSGGGTVSIQVSPNSATTQRMANVTIAGGTLAVTQTGVCAFTVTPASLSAPAEGTASGGFTITTTVGCAWSAAGMPSWITMATGTRTGSGTLSYVIAPNVDIARSATLTIAGQSIPVDQHGAVVPRPANLLIVKGGD